MAHETPLQHAPILSATLNNRVLLKREDMQPVFSFKIRGAYNKISQLSRDQLSKVLHLASILALAQRYWEGSTPLAILHFVLSPSSYD